jgi:hypothetical protein
MLSNRPSRRTLRSPLGRQDRFVEPQVNGRYLRTAVDVNRDYDVAVGEIGHSR